MDCKKFKETYLHFIYKEIDEKEGAFHKKHIKSCKKCKESWEEAEKTRLLFSNFEDLEPPEYIVNKIKEYAGNYNKPKENWLENIIFLFRIPKIRLALVALAIMAVLLIPSFLKKNRNTPKNPEEEISLIAEDELDKAIENIEYNTLTLSEEENYSGFTSEEDIWEISYMDQKISDMENEVKLLKKDFSKF